MFQFVYLSSFLTIQTLHCSIFIFWTISRKESVLSALRILICGDDYISNFEVCTIIIVYQ